MSPQLEECIANSDALKFVATKNNLTGVASCSICQAPVTRCSNCTLESSHFWKEDMTINFSKETVQSPPEPKKEYTGGSVSYYKVFITNPTSGGDQYTAECNDIIEALGMSFAEGNIMKAIWRRCAARNGMSKQGYKDGLYDAEKVVFFGQRLVEQEKAKNGN